MKTENQEESRLVVRESRDAAHVDDAEMRAVAALYMSHAGGLFPKDMTPKQAGIMARLSLAYGLDPLADELLLFQGKPYLTIQGRTRKALDHPEYDGLECEPATEEERKAHRVADDEFFYIARVWRKDKRFPFPGYGRAGGRADKNPVSGQYGQEMAIKRAKSRALRDAFSMPLPDFEDQQNERTADTTRRYEVAPVIDAEAIVLRDDVDTDTGEIAESGSDSHKGPIAKIHTLVSLMKWSDEEYRTLLREAFDVGSSTELPDGQATALCECLESVLANAQEEGRRVETAEIVERMKGSAATFRSLDGDDDPAWKESQRKDAEQMETLKTKYERLIREAGPLGIDLAGFEIDASIKAAQLIRTVDRLEVAIAAKTGKPPADVEPTSAGDLGRKASVAQVDWIRSRLEAAAPEIVTSVGTIDYDKLTVGEVRRIRDLLDGKAAA